MFYSIAWHIESISSNNPERACDVALLCVLSQHPSWPVAFASINHTFILGCDGTHIATTTPRRLQQAMTLLSRVLPVMPAPIAVQYLWIHKHNLDPRLRSHKVQTIDLSAGPVSEP